MRINFRNTSLLRRATTAIAAFWRRTWSLRTTCSAPIAYSKAMTDRELVARIARSAGGKAGYKQLVRELGLGGGRERRLLLEQLARLTARGTLVKLDREHWSIPERAGASTSR